MVATGLQYAWREERHVLAAMTSRTATATTRRPNRLLIALAAAWMILSLAIGGMAADTGADQAPPTRATVEQARR